MIETERGKGDYTFKGVCGGKGWGRKLEVVRTDRYERINR